MSGRRRRAMLGLLVALIAAPGLRAPADDAPATDTATVRTRTPLLDRPVGSALTVGWLEPGESVEVVREESGGWLAVVSPRDCLSWIEEDAILEEANGLHARVTVAQATVHPGSTQSKLPGAAGVTLPHGTRVTLVKMRPLSLAAPGGTRRFRAIEPPPGEFRYIRSSSVRWARPAQRVSEAVESPSDLPPPPVEERPSLPSDPPSDALPAEPAPGEDEVLAPAVEIDALLRFEPPLASVGLAPDIQADMEQAEAMHRDALRAPVDQWRLEPIRVRYKTVLSRSTDPGLERVVEARLALLDRQDEAAADARMFRALLARSRAHDRQVVAQLRPRADAATGAARPYDAVGLLQPSSRMVDGTRVEALITPGAESPLYVLLPPGIDRDRWLSKRVGIRGRAGYDPDLRARVIRVREIVELESATALKPRRIDAEAPASGPN